MRFNNALQLRDSAFLVWIKNYLQEHCANLCVRKAALCDLHSASSIIDRVRYQRKRSSAKPTWFKVHAYLGQVYWRTSIIVI